MSDAWGEKVRASYDMHVMAASEAGHRLTRVLDGLTAEQASEVRDLLSAIGSAGTHAPARASWFAGYLTQQLSRHGVCPACGSNHDDELAATGAGENGTA